MLLFDLIKLLLENPAAFIIAFSMLMIPLLMSITVHEWAHGFVAYLFGDPTAKNQGRLSLNPIRHIDPLGALMLFVIGIGWAKPVPVNPMYFKNKYQYGLVAIAGPMSNFIMAITFSLLVYLIAVLAEAGFINEKINFVSGLVVVLVILMEKVVLVNLMLGIFNLLPIPPLDGSNIVRSLLPNNMAEVYFRIAPYGYFLLVLLLFSGGINYIVRAAYYMQDFIMFTLAHFLPKI